MLEPTQDSWRTCFVVGLALIVGSSCRGSNPGFFDRPSANDDAVGDDGLQIDTGGDPANNTQGEPGATQSLEASNSIRGETNGAGSSVASTIGSGSQASATNNTVTHSSTGASSSLCNKGERLCYLMNRNASSNNYADAAGRETALSLSQNDMKETSLEDSSDSRFSNYVRISQNATFVPETAFGPPASETYGFDVTVRNGRCEGLGRCALAVVGNLGLAFVHSVGGTGLAAECFYLSATLEGRESVSVSVPKQGTSVVGCEVENERLNITLNGGPGTSESLSKSTALNKFTFEVGGKNGWMLMNLWIGDIGRIRLWSDLVRMRSVLASES